MKSGTLLRSVVQYTLDDSDTLRRYLERQAPKMRDTAFKVFKAEEFKAARRFLEQSTKIDLPDETKTHF